MPLWTHPGLRSIARRLRITRLVQRVQGLRGRDYEVAFNRALRESVRPGDTVWDVGANLGHYTALFSDWAGAGGQVVAFEPVPATFDALRASADGRANVRLVNVALGDRDGTLPIALSDDPTSGGNSFAARATPGATVVELPVRRGDAVGVDEGLPEPDVLKIDVEGFEEEVLDGLAQTLARPSCRAVLCEIHFALLESRGRRDAPGAIVGKLEAHGFDVEWVDASHLAARRGNGAKAA